MRKSRFYIFLAALLSFVGCEGDTTETNPNFGFSNLADVTSSSFSVYPSSNYIGKVSAYIFRDDILDRVESNCAVGADGVVEMIASADPLGRVVIVGGALTTIDAVVGETTREELLATRLDNGYGKSGASQLYTTEVSFNRVANGNAAIELSRLFSRVDIDVDTSSGAVVTAVSFNNVATTFNIGSNNNLSQEQELKTIDIELSSSISNKSTALHYIYATTYSSAADVTLQLKLSSGATTSVKATLPETILPNKIYTINVGATKATISTSDWGYSINDNDNQYPTDLITVDSALTSGLPDAAIISVDGQSIQDMPYVESRFTLALKCDDPIELYGTERCVVEELSTNVFDITLKRNAIGESEKSVTLYLRRKNLSVAYGETITLVQDLNPIAMSGAMMDYMAPITSTFNATTFVDNELLEVTIPDNYSIFVSCDDSSRQWLRCVESYGKHIVQGGFRPNDVESNGITESGRIIFTLPDGSTDEYDISRINWGIPVIWFNGNYWSKFNLRGNPNSYEDQLRVSDPLASITDLYSHLKSCSADDFYKIAGGTYVGQQSRSLTLAAAGSDKLFSDYVYSSIPAGHINNTAAEFNTPNGFRRPSWDDMGSIFMSGTLTLAMTNNETAANQSYNTAANSTHGVYRQAFYGYTGILGQFQMMQLTAAVSSNQSEPMVLTGYGAQWSDTGYSASINMYAAHESTLPSSSTNLMWTFASGTYQTKIYAQPYSSNYHIRAVKDTVAFTY